MSNERPSSGSWQLLESAWRAEAGPPETGPEMAPSVLEPGENTSTDQLYRQIVSLGRRQQRLALLTFAGELVVGLTFGALAVHWLANGSPSERIAGAFTLTFLLAVALVRRQVWLDRRSAPEASPRDFAQTLADRNAAGIRAVTLGKRMLAVQVVFFLVWLPWHLPAPKDLWSGYTFLVLWTAAFLLALLATHRYLDRERQRIEQLSLELFK